MQWAQIRPLISQELESRSCGGHKVTFETPPLGFPTHRLSAIWCQRTRKSKGDEILDRAQHQGHEPREGVREPLISLQALQTAGPRSGQSLCIRLCFCDLAHQQAVIRITARCRETFYIVPCVD